MNAARSRRTGGYSLVEVMVALAVLLVGVVGVLQFFPPTLRASSDAAMRGHAALLAQRKAEEIRRDLQSDAFSGESLLDEILALNSPTFPRPFPEDDRLVYQFFNRSLLYDPLAPDDPSVPDDDPGVARLIVRYNGDFRPAPGTSSVDVHRAGDILMELRFDR